MLLGQRDGSVVGHGSSLDATIFAGALHQVAMLAFDLHIVDLRHPDAVHRAASVFKATDPVRVRLLGHVRSIPFEH